MALAKGDGILTTLVEAAVSPLSNRFHGNANQNFARTDGSSAGGDGSQKPAYLVYRSAIIFSIYEFMPTGVTVESFLHHLVVLYPFF